MKRSRKPIGSKVNFRPIQEDHVAIVYNDFDATAGKDLVGGTDFVGVVHYIGKPQSSPWS